MARINIEDSIYRDERFHKLSAFEGKHKALGLCVAAWDLAHRWFLKHPEGLIPIAEWDNDPELLLLEKYGLAERKKNGIYVKGSRDECQYLTKRVLAGRKGGLKSQEKISSKHKQIEQNRPSSSSSFSISENNNNICNANALRASELEKLYQAYPRKLGKAEGLSRLKNMIKTEQDYRDFEKAVANYSAFIKREKIEPRFIKQFSSFVGSQKVQPWRDYLDDDVGKTLEEKKQKKIYYTVEDLKNDL